MKPTAPVVERVGVGPIVSVDSSPSIGANIQGPSLVEIPDWVDGRLGSYYLYFADHKGHYIRLAFADSLDGPWTVHEPGCLHLKDSHYPTEDLPLSDDQFAQILGRVEARLGDATPIDLRMELTAAHIASPDVHVDHSNRRLVMYFHGLHDVGSQVSRVAVSENGLTWRVEPDVLIDRTYLRAFTISDGFIYGIAMPGVLYRADDWLGPFIEGPTLFGPDFRHCAVDARDGAIDIYWTRVGDTPERILVSTVDTTHDWMRWTESEPVDVVRPEHVWEGSAEPLVPSVRGAVNRRVNQLRDPAVFRTSNGALHLAYAVAGESGIALAKLG